MAWSLKAIFLSVEDTSVLNLAKESKYLGIVSSFLPGEIRKIP